MDVGRVIKGLESLHRRLLDAATLDSIAMLDANMVSDAIALLKAQEPRVMTLEEVRDEAEYMFLEKHSETGSDLYGCAIRGDCDGYGIELLMGEYDCARGRWRDYGKTWRCWSSRPTDEQRKAVAWIEA